MAFPHGTARCWASRIRKWWELTARRRESWEILPTRSIIIARLLFICREEMAALWAICVVSHTECHHTPHSSQWLRAVKIHIIQRNVKCHLLCLYPYSLHLLTEVFVCVCRVEKAYQRISGPAFVTVDASPSADQVLQQVLRLIRAKCHL